MRVSTRAPHAEEFRSFASIVRDHDGVEAFGEASQRDVYEDRPARYLALYDDGLVALAVMGRQGTELAVHPDYRRSGIGTELIAHVTETVTPKVWANGNGPGAQALARIAGLEPVRSVVKMVWTASELPVSSDVTPLDAGDVEEFVAVNNAAFADHPDQGGLTAEEFAKRGGEVLVAKIDGRIAGFAWIKTDPAELYVLGVSPDFQGRGLGKTLTRAALSELVGRGADSVQLFCSGSDERALGLYDAMGFEAIRTDVMYGAPTSD